MISTYTLSQAKLQPQTVTSNAEIKAIGKKSGWAWVDCVDPTEEETQIIAEIVGSEEVKSIIKSKEILTNYQKINGFTMIQLVQVDFVEKLETYPLYVFTNDQIMVTVRTEKMSELIKSTMETLQNCIKRVTCESSSSFVISRLFHEVVDHNLNIVVTLREKISELQESAIAKAENKKIDEKVFALKREIARFERILWGQRDVMYAIQEGVVPSIQTTQVDKEALSITINNLSRELSLIPFHVNALDSVLTVRGLGLIHRVETNLVYLTITLIVLTVFLILLAPDILRLILG